MNIKAQVKRVLRGVGNALNSDLKSDAIIRHQQDRLDRSKNPLNKFGLKSFSQSDEDGITLEIVRRLGIENGTYCEYGVADGLECNTISLAAIGWRGFWVSGGDLAYSLDDVKPSVFSYIKTWVSSDNILSTYKQGCKYIETENIDLLSFDLDYNDLHYVERLLQGGIQPKICIIEYNAKFIPPIKWCIQLDDEGMWDGTDYMGASLQSFVDLFQTYGYTLICCNAATGANAFFVDNACLGKFEDIPTDILNIYQTPYYKTPRIYGHTSNPRTVQEIFRRVSPLIEN